MTWNDAWAVLNKDGALTERRGQRSLAEWVFYVTQAGGTLLGEAAVGVGKSYAYCIPLIYAVQQDGVRAVVSTETTTLQDQLFDKDLPRLAVTFADKPFKFRSLKGRNWYLCRSKGRSATLLTELGTKDLGDGERRDVERVLGRRLSEDEWDTVASEAEFCAQNKCKPEHCFSSRARQLAASADIVVTNHAMLRTHAEMEDGLLGDFQHLVVDEAHTLEHALVDGWATEMTPYDAFKALESMWDALDATNLKYTQGGYGEEAERLFKEGVDSVIKLFGLLAKQRDSNGEWKRESFALGQVFLSGAVDAKVGKALEEYELLGPGRFLKAGERFAQLNKLITAEVTDLRDQGKRVGRKISKGMTGTKKLAELCAMLAESLETRHGVIQKYGTTYVAIGEGRQHWKRDPELAIRCVPLDISGRARESIWKGLKSVTLVSGTLRDETDGSFRYLKASLGIDDAHEIVVRSSFDYSANQLIYVTPAKEPPIDVVGAQFSINELLQTIDAAQGRTLVLFTANAEMEYTAETLRALQERGLFPHRLLIQEKGVNKNDLARQFMSDTSSVLLGSKSFFTGVDFAGDACSVVAIVKYPRPRWDPLCRAQADHWRKRGFPQWYTREAMQVFKQANGRLIRNETDRGVIAILDQRAADPRNDVSTLVGLEATATGSALTSSLLEVQNFLDARPS